jgi:hypothetical protein
VTDFAAIDPDWSRRLGVGRAEAFYTPQAGAVTYSLPTGDDAFLWRFVMNSRCKVHSLAELDRDWTYPDMLSMHNQLDEIENALSREHARAEKAAKGGR